MKARALIGDRKRAAEREIRKFVKVQRYPLKSIQK
jgi:hypothetical protein